MNTKIMSLLTSAVLTGMLASQAAQAGEHKKGGHKKDHKECKMKKDGKGECCGKGEKVGCGGKGSCSGMATDKATAPEGEAPAAAMPADATQTTPADAGKGK